MRIFLFIVGLVAAGFLAYKYVPNAAQTIENKVTENVTAALVPNNLPADVQIKVDGRDVALSGTVVKPSDKENFVGLSQGVTGVRAVQDDLVIAEALDVSPDVSFDVIDEVGDEQAVDTIDENAENILDVATDIINNAPEEALVEESFVSEDVALLDIEAVPEMVKKPVIDLAVQEAVEPVEGTSDGVISAPDIEVLEDVQDTAQEEVIVMDESDKKASQECQSTIAALVTGKRVNFTTGQSKIKRESLPLLNDIAQEMRGCSDIAVHIHGHTDNVGDATLNRQLSHKRARSVGLYLLRQGVTQRIKIFGHGADQPIADNTTESGRTANRRIEFNVKDVQASVANDNERTDRSTFTTRSLRNTAIIER